MNGGCGWVPITPGGRLYSGEGEGFRDLEVILVFGDTGAREYYKLVGG